MSHPTPEIAVVGATGTMGRLVLDELLARDIPVLALVRRHVADLPPEVQQVLAPLGDQAALDVALRGIRAAFYVSPHESAEEEYADRFIRAAEANGTRIVFAGVHVAARTPLQWAQRQLTALFLPHYRGKLRLARRIARRAKDAVIFMPTNFYQNDEIFEDDIRAGRFPLPMRLVNRVDVRDLAELCAVALLDPAYPTGQHLVAGPESLSGAECAQLWSRALGRPVAYVGDNEAIWRPIFTRRLSGQKLTDLVATSLFLGNRPVVLPQAAAATERLLGRPLRTYPDYVAERAAPVHAGAAQPSQETTR